MSYRKYVEKHMSKIEKVLKLVGTPVVMLVERFRIMWPDGGMKELQTVMALKGMKRQEQATVLETFGGSGAGGVGGAAGGGGGGAAGGGGVGGAGGGSGAPGAADGGGAGVADASSAAVGGLGGAAGGGGEWSGPGSGGGSGTSGVAGMSGTLPKSFHPTALKKGAESTMKGMKGAMDDFSKAFR